MQFLNTLRVPVFIGVAVSTIAFIYSVLIAYKLRLSCILYSFISVFVYRWEFYAYFVGFRGLFILMYVLYVLVLFCVVIWSYFRLLVFG